MAPLAFDLVPYLGALCILLVVALLVVVAAPWRRREDAGAMDDDVQARLMLGDDPDDIERDLEARTEGTAPVAQLRPPEE